MADRTPRLLAEGLLRDTERVFGKQLEVVVGILNHHPELKRILGRGDIPLEEKRKIVDDVFKDSIDPQVRNMVLMLAAGGRLNLLESIQNEFVKMARENSEVVYGTVESAFPIDDSMLARLEDKFTAIFGKRIKLSLHVNPSLIGGVVVTVEDKVFDGSVRSRLNEIKEHILRD